MQRVVKPGRLLIRIMQSPLLGTEAAAVFRYRWSEKLGILRSEGLWREDEVGDRMAAERSPASLVPALLCGLPCRTEAPVRIAAISSFELSASNSSSLFF